QVGTPPEIYEQPATRFVAEFIGRMNFLPGVVINASNGRGVIRLASGSTVSLAIPASVNVSDKVEMTVRPERASLSTVEPKGDGLCLPCRVTNILYLGSSSTRFDSDARKCRSWETNSIVPSYWASACTSMSLVAMSKWLVGSSRTSRLGGSYSISAI